MEDKLKVVCWWSGGIASAVACYLRYKKPNEVVGYMCINSISGQIKLTKSTP